MDLMSTIPKLLRVVLINVFLLYQFVAVRIWTALRVNETLDTFETLILENVVVVLLKVKIRGTQF